MERYRLGEALFQSALDRGPAVLDSACAGDGPLRAEVEALLGSYQAWSAEVPAAPEPSLPRFGPYACDSVLGAGGMGTVYRAHRDDGQFAQDVAIKVLRGSLRSDWFRQRFLAERQTLARLNHPNIARLLDGGVTADGEPYLAMELVEGEPLDTYCDRLQLSVEKRIELFEQVIEAVDYAHRNLVVHRDLKPSNILVTAQCQVKLLDFGTSKLADEDSGTTLNRALTPRYASPEQLRGEPLTTATDIFSLGVMLYELLSGKWPFGDPESAADAWRRVAQETDPAPVDRRQLKGISQSLALDLNAILLKALDHQPDKRYRSVEELQEDLHRFAAGRAVLARRQTSVYRVRKFSWRYRWQLAGAAIVLLALVGATLLSVRQARAERLHAAVAQRESERAKRLAHFTTQTLMAVSPSYQSPLAGSPAAATITDLLDNAVRRVGPAFRGDPAGEAEMRGTIGQAYAELGQLDKARPLAERALAMARTIGPGFENQFTRILAQNCDLASFRGEVSLARRLCQESFDTLNRAADPDPNFQFGIAHDLAFMMYNDGAPPEDVERLYLQSAAIAERNFGRQDIRWAIAMTRVGETRLRAGKAPEAGQILRDVLALMRSLPGPPIEILGALRAMARFERGQGEYGKSEALLKEALSVFDKKPAGFYSRTELEVELLYVQTLAGRAAEAVKRALALARAPEPETEVRALGYMVAGLALSRTGSPLQAEPWLRKAVDLYRARPANRAAAHAEALNALAECLSRSGRGSEAAQVMEEARKRAAEGSAYTTRK